MDVREPRVSRPATSNAHATVGEACGHLDGRFDEFAVLDYAAELVSRGWCQTVLAMDQDGRQVEPWSESASSWSPLGALMRTWYLSRGVRCEAFEIAYTALASATGGRLEEWNAARWRTKRHVLSAFARAHGYVPAVRRQVRARAADPPAHAA